jgi:hypothetical protein
MDCMIKEVAPRMACDGAKAAGTGVIPRAQVARFIGIESKRIMGMGSFQAAMARCKSSSKQCLSTALNTRVK